MKQPCQKWQGCWFYGSRKDAGGMPDKSLGRSIAPRGSSRSNCQVKAILHGTMDKIKAGIECRGMDIRKGRDVDVRNGREMVAGLNRKREDPTSP